MRCRAGQLGHGGIVEIVVERVLARLFDGLGGDRCGGGDGGPGVGDQVVVDQRGLAQPLGEGAQRRHLGAEVGDLGLVVGLDELEAPEGLVGRLEGGSGLGPGIGEDAVALGLGVGSDLVGGGVGVRDERGDLAFGVTTGGVGFASGLGGEVIGLDLGILADLAGGCVGFGGDACRGGLGLADDAGGVGFGTAPEAGCLVERPLGGEFGVGDGLIGGGLGVLEQAQRSLGRWLDSGRRSRGRSRRRGLGGEVVDLGVERGREALEVLDARSSVEQHIARAIGVDLALAQLGVHVVAN